MARRDIYHNTVKQSLQKDGWTITHDPLPLKVGYKRLEVDLGAERLISAEKGLRKIAVEVKSFIGRSNVTDLERALGQYVLYDQIMMEQGIRRELYLAVNWHTYETVFQIPLGEILLRNEVVNLLVFDDEEEVVVQWIPE
ncbi:MAG: element excision factor XisH family protein [Ardenticatenaceae bacterium]